jgi:hypothetical protein
MPYLIVKQIKLKRHFRSHGKACLQRLARQVKRTERATLRIPIIASLVLRDEESNCETSIFGPTSTSRRHNIAIDAQATKAIDRLWIEGQKYFIALLFAWRNNIALPGTRKRRKEIQKE